MKTRRSWQLKKGSKRLLFNLGITLSTLIVMAKCADIELETYSRVITNAQNPESISPTRLQSTSRTSKTQVILRTDNILQITSSTSQLKIDKTQIDFSQQGHLSCYPNKDICIACGNGGCVSLSISYPDIAILGFFFHKKYRVGVESKIYTDYVYRVLAIKHTNFFVTVENMNFGGGGLFRWNFLSKNCYERHQPVSDEKSIFDHFYYLRALRYTKFVALSIPEQRKILFFDITDVSAAASAFEAPGESAGTSATLSSLNSVKGVGPFDYLTRDPQKNLIYVCNKNKQCFLLQWSTKTVKSKQDIVSKNDIQPSMKHYSVDAIPQTDFVFITLGRYLVLKRALGEDYELPKNSNIHPQEYIMKGLGSISATESFIQVFASPSSPAFYALTTDKLISFHVKYTEPQSTLQQQQQQQSGSGGAINHQAQAACHQNCLSETNSLHCNGKALDATQCNACKPDLKPLEGLICSKFFSRTSIAQPYGGYVLSLKDFGFFDFIDPVCVNSSTLLPSQNQSMVIGVDKVNQSSQISGDIFWELADKRWLWGFGTAFGILGLAAVCLFRDFAGARRLYNPMNPSDLGVMPGVPSLNNDGSRAVNLGKGAQGSAPGGDLVPRPSHPKVNYTNLAGGGNTLL